MMADAVDSSWAEYLGCNSGGKIGFAVNENFACFPNVTLLMKAFEDVENSEVLHHEYYSKCNEVLGSISYTLEDIENFCSMIDGGIYKKWGIGMYVSASINRIIGETDTVMLNFPGDVRKMYLGSYLSKGRIIIGCSVDSWLGYYMNGGSIVVKGNCGTELGHGMSAGEILVEGMSNESVGFDMRGGKITVMNYSGNYVGDYMESGVIYIFGDGFDPGEGIGKGAKKGRIYYNNKLAWENGCLLV